MPAFESRTLSDLLNREFSRRKQRNGAYSLRAFARDLHLSPSRLSEVLSGKHGVSGPTVETIANRLARSDKERGFILDLVLAEFARSKKVRELARERVHETRKLQAYRRLNDDQFRVISDWYHGALLELISVADFKSDVEWIARRLGITRSQARGAVDRLMALGMIEQVGDHWRAKPEAFSAFSEVPSSAVRKFHLQVLNMAADSLREDALPEREFLSLFLAVPRSRLPEFEQEMRKFVTEFWQRIADEPKDDLYTLSLQLFPVKNRQEKKL